MMIAHRLPSALCICAVVAILAGCGGSQPPIGAPGAGPQTSTVAARADRRRSWMFPGLSKSDLIYVVASPYPYVLSYPWGAFEGVIYSVGFSPGSVCANASGDVFFVGGPATDGEVAEYEHGGSEPVATLADDYGAPVSCAVDPTTGNLAVANQRNASEGPGNVIIYPGAQGTPAVYADPELTTFYGCAYDSHGNLAVNGGGYGVRLAELPAGGSELINLME